MLSGYSITLHLVILLEITLGKNRPTFPLLKLTVFSGNFL